MGTLSSAQIVFVLCCISSALAWWEYGHMTVAQVAKLELEARSPEVNAYIDQLVDLVADYAEEDTKTFVESAVWADDIKSVGLTFWNDWHFINRPINDEGIQNYPAFSEGEDLLYGINQTSLVLGNVSNKPFSLEKVISLRMLIHLIGDLHQPLHASSRFTHNQPSGDQGGNLFNVTYQDQVMNLHAFWDAGAKLLPEVDRPLNDSTRADLEAFAKELMANHTRESYKDDLAVVEVEKWTFPTYREAREEVYAPLVQAGNTTITDKYQQDSFQLVARNLALGGYRLHDHLVRILTPTVEALKAKKLSLRKSK